MFNAKTVFIVGAGASAEIGLPTGAKLIESMVPQLKFDPDEFYRPTRGDKALFEVIQQTVRNQDRYQYTLDLKNHVLAAEKISKGLNYAMSIDNFIDIHKGDPCIEFCGKLAIASNILKA
jgi:NAD-dependent SIR2 family protein deacetylase